jgi:hypothetical protein
MPLATTPQKENAMVNLSVSNVAPIIQIQLQAHTDLSEHLIHTQAVLDFIRDSNLAHFQNLALHEQLVSLDNLIKDAADKNTALHGRLTQINPWQPPFNAYVQEQTLGHVHLGDHLTHAHHLLGLFLHSERELNQFEAAEFQAQFLKVHDALEKAKEENQRLEANLVQFNVGTLVNQKHLSG